MSYGVGAASEWKDVLVEAAKGIVILVILERLCLTRRVSWFEVRTLRRGMRHAGRRSGAHSRHSAARRNTLIT